MLYANRIRKILVEEKLGIKRNVMFVCKLNLHKTLKHLNAPATYKRKEQGCIHSWGFESKESSVQMLRHDTGAFSLCAAAGPVENSMVLRST